ncbi:carbohydrate ABC transporter permease [soil metagenome]
MNPLRRRDPLDLSSRAKLGAYVLLLLWAIIVLVPLYWLFITAFKTPVAVDTGPFYLPFVDFQPTLEHWDHILFGLGSDNLRPYVNTVVVAVSSSVIALVVGAAAAYALVRFRYRPTLGMIALFVGTLAYAFVVTALGAPWPVSVASAVAIFLILAGAVARRSRRSLGNADIAFWLISQRMLPPVAVVIPIYVLYQNLGLLDTLTGLIVTYVATNLPIVIWLMRDYFASVPIELEESAGVDGASPYRIFRSIVLPVSVPGLVATFLFVLVFAWNEYLLALFLSSANAQTMPLTVAAQNATRGPQWWYMSVLIVLMIGPVIAMAVALERYISRGILIGAVKG